jgi:CheY-like chemotaxis protein
LADQRSVLIVDRCGETREVLQTALQHRGMRTLAAGGARRGLELARQHRPDLIVLDLEADVADWGDLSAPLVEQSRRHCTPLVLLGRAYRNGHCRPGEEFVAKPYHYGPLIRRIEELLGQTQPTPGGSD